MPTPAMIAVRPVNEKLGNLSRHFVTEILSAERALLLRFSAAGVPAADFTVRLDDVIEFVDRGTVRQPLTAGVVWAPPAEFGRDVAAQWNVPPDSLIELRLDFEDSTGLVSRFNAIAHSVRLS